MNITDLEWACIFTVMGGLAFYLLQGAVNDYKRKKRLKNIRIRFPDEKNW